MLKEPCGKLVKNLAQAVIDTKILVALMVDDGKNHKQAMRIWEETTKALVPTVVLFELAFFLVKYNLSLEILEKVVTNPKIEVISNNLDDVLYLTWYAKNVKYYDDLGDILILSVSKRLGIEIKTFDRKLGSVDI